MGTTRVRFIEITHEGDAREVLGALTDFMQQTFGTTPTAQPAVLENPPSPTTPMVETTEPKPIEPPAKRRGRPSQHQPYADKLLAWAQKKAEPFTLRDASIGTGDSMYCIGKAIDILLDQSLIEISTPAMGRLGAKFGVVGVKSERGERSSNGFPVATGEEDIGG